MMMGMTFEGLARTADTRVMFRAPTGWTAGRLVGWYRLQPTDGWTGQAWYYSPRPERFQKLAQLPAAAFVDAGRCAAECPILGPHLRALGEARSA